MKWFAERLVVIYFGLLVLGLLAILILAGLALLKYLLS